ncbi:MAG: carbamoyltransferase C-terminal domain-containing protein [Planctomycetota bacterium]
MGKKINVLGIHDGHNATVAMIQEGQTRYCASEERFSGRKNEIGFPILAMQAGLREIGLDPSMLDAVAFSSIHIPPYWLKTKRETLFTIDDYLKEQREYWYPLLFEGRENLEYRQTVIDNPRFHEPSYYDFKDYPMITSKEEDIKNVTSIRQEAIRRSLGIDLPIATYDHHLCHAHYAYFASPFRKEPCLVFTADGGGDGCNGTVWIAEHDTLREIRRNNCSDLARIYRYITLHLGMKMGEHEYKVMGLAPYAPEHEIKRCRAVFDTLFKIEDGMIVYRNKPRDLYYHFREALEGRRFDAIAAAAQAMVEEVGSQWVESQVRSTGIGRVVFSGGLSMNVKLNKRISELPGVREFFCAASGGDESLALGAAYAEAAVRKAPAGDFVDSLRGVTEARDAALEVLSSMKNVDLEVNAGNKRIAQLLAQGKVVGRVEGPMEFGARALGNRSLLAHPSFPGIREKINHQIKGRDFWMPFAPTVLDSHAERYLLRSKGCHAEHMTMALDTTELGRKDLDAAVHAADHTARAHILRRELNPDYYDLIESFAQITGIGGILNTSFNLHGLPIVRGAKEARHVFENSRLDAMVVAGVLVIRK